MINQVGSTPMSDEDREAQADLLAKGLLGGLIFSCDDVDALFEHVQADRAPRCCRSRPTSSTAYATARSATRPATWSASRPRCSRTDVPSGVAGSER